MSCPHCFTGYPKSAKPGGQVSVVYGRNTYIAQPEDNTVEIKGIIVMIPDAFGWEFVNNRLLADHYASQGSFKVYLPDFMDGAASPLWMMDVFASLMKENKKLKDYLQLPYYSFLGLRGFLPFIVKNRSGVSMAKIRHFLQALRNFEEGRYGVGVAGFCWGGLFAIRLAQGMTTDDNKPLADAVFTAHPSNAELPGDFERVKKPISLAIGDKDFMLSVDKIKRVQETWKNLKDVNTEITVYPGAGHGFSIRADPLNANQAEQSAEAEAQAVRWFEKHLSGLVG